MPKAEGDTKAPKTEGPVKSAAETTPEPIPPVHVLEAAQRQDRKETDDLLAGFDKPGRSPRRVPSGDFVDYYGRKKAPATASPPEVRLPMGRPDASTVIIPRKKTTAWWLPYAGVTAIMMTLVGAIAYVATADAPPKPAPPPVTSASSSLPVATTTMMIDIPPPEPVTTTPVVMSAETPSQIPAPRKKRDAVASSSAAASPPPPPSAPVPSNSTYIRNLLPTVPPSE
jgi:hypothetical protein